MTTKTGDVRNKGHIQHEIFLLRFFQQIYKRKKNIYPSTKMLHPQATEIIQV